MDLITGRYKRSGRPGTPISVAVHANVVIPDNRGVNVPYIFGVRMDAGATGMVGLFRTNAFLGETKTEKVPEQPMSLDGWFVTPFASQGDSWAYLERVAADDLPFLADGAKPLATFLPAEKPTKKAHKVTEPAQPVL
jgi:hypothetical protein